MPKSKACLAVKLRKFVEEFPCFETDGSVLICIYCSTKLDVCQRSHITQHVNGLKHQKNAKSKKNEVATKQTLLTTTINKKR